MHMGSSIVQFLPVRKIILWVWSASLKETVVNYEIVPDRFDGVLETMDVFKNDTGILVARTAGTVSHGTALVKLMNVGESEVTLHANTCLGSFYAAVSNDVK